MRHLIAALFISTIAACTTTDTTEPTPHTDSTDVAPPQGCAQACRVALGLCGGDADERQLATDCSSDCPFSAAELRCLSAFSCGDDTSSCY
jgi:hypothetical protein